jgi:DHA3 family macrolide efflux protein-like MFS transporter
MEVNEFTRHPQIPNVGALRTHLGGATVSLLGSQLVSVALIWWLTKSTGSATVLATTHRWLGWFPGAARPLWQGLVDRWNRRVVMMVADSLIALFTLLLAVYSPWKSRIWHVYLLMFLRSVAGGFRWPAMAPHA